MDTFSALADPTRRTIIEMLAARGQLSATDISDKFTISPPAISQHLKVLQEVKLVDMEKRAQQRIYTINTETILSLENWTHKMVALWDQRFDKMEKLIAREKMRKLVKDK